uniref:AlNc14C1332G12892 protein n=1 Tax=Albugo laibachii Nc14 TaxID=890382 RepID=F0X2N3_9STRA|nr:AlNc14C1332G12892 [Albugo laibachii Nc14]|eukprot:CCA28152.1 AlNc14C1332G12892 [Albugo laibachii Nc14]
MDFKDERDRLCLSYYNNRIDLHESQSTRTRQQNELKRLKKSHKVEITLWCRNLESESWIEQAIGRLTCLFFLESTAYIVSLLICLSILTTIMTVLYAMQRGFTQKIKRILGPTRTIPLHISHNTTSAKTVAIFCILCSSALTALAGWIGISQWVFYTTQLLGKESTLGPSFYHILFGTITSTAGFIVAVFYRLENAYRVKSYYLNTRSNRDIPYEADSRSSAHSGLLRSFPCSENFNPLELPANYKI